MQKKLMMAVAIVGAVGISLTLSGATANAQLFPTGSTTTPSSSVVNATTTASSTISTSSTMSTPTTTQSTTTGTASSVTNPVPIYVVAPTTTTSSTASGTVKAPTATVPPSAGFFQLNGLTVTSVSPAGVAPMQIVATGSGATCEQFVTDISPTGTSTNCPTPATIMTTPVTSTASVSNPEFTVIVDAASKLLTSNRAATTLANIVPGDRINVYGYYDGIGTMDAEIVRDLSLSSTGTGTGTTVAGGGTTAELQAELNQLETLAIQLEAELGMTTTTTTDLIDRKYIARTPGFLSDDTGRGHEYGRMPTSLLHDNQLQHCQSAYL